jgi:hypothetical protein
MPPLYVAAECFQRANLLDRVSGIWPGWIPTSKKPKRTPAEMEAYV